MRLPTSVLAGDAWDWWAHLGAAAPAGWTALVDALRARFQPVTSAETARAKLASLAQGKASVNEYISAFRRLLVAVPTMGVSGGLSRHLKTDRHRPACPADL